MMVRCSVALKDWAPVIAALGRGQQIVALRKYKPAHEVFFLMMTYTFPRKSLKPEYKELVEDSLRNKQRERATLAFYGQCEKVIVIEDKDALARLSDHYVWTPEHVMSYFGKRTPYIWLVRVFRLPSPITVDRSRAMVYQTLDPPISTKGAVPVLSDEEFHQVVHQIEQAIAVGPLPDELEELRRQIATLKEEIRQKQMLIDKLTAGVGILSDEELEQLPEHDRLIYKFGLILETFGFEEIQLDLPTTHSWSPFNSAQITAHRVHEKEYDLKAIHGSKQYIGEVHCRGNLASTLVKLNYAAISGAAKIVILADREQERQVRRELRTSQFWQLTTNLKRYYSEEIDKLYDFCHTHYSLKAEVKQKQAELEARDPVLQEKLGGAILDKPTFYEELLRR